MGNILGDFIKKYRLDNDLSLRDFGKLADISHTHIDSIERGSDPRTGKTVKITNETLQKLAKATNTDPTFLFELSIGNSDIKNFAPELNKKDQKDISKKLSSLLEELNNDQEALMFDGEVLDEETKELLKSSLKNSLETGKLLAKQKFTPKKYRKQ